MKTHKRNCVTEYHTRLKIAISMMLLFISGLVVYLFEKYFFSIPWPLAALMVTIVAVYLIHTLRELQRLDGNDAC